MRIPTVALALLAAALSGSANARRESKPQTTKLFTAENAPVVYTQDAITHDSRTSVQRRQNGNGPVGSALGLLGILICEFLFGPSLLSSMLYSRSSVALRRRFQVGCIIG